MMLDFSKFNAEAADFYLIVGSSEILDVAVRQIACQVATPVKARSRLRAVVLACNRSVYIRTI